MTECYDTKVPYHMARNYALRQEEVNFGELLQAIYFTTYIQGEKYRLTIMINPNHNASLDIESYDEYLEKIKKLQQEALRLFENK